MDRKAVRKTLIGAALIAMTALGTTATTQAQPGGYGPGYGMGPGMMGGYGPGYGMGPGMMGGYGPSYGMGPGMMGPGMMGPGMMGGYGPGYGMGPGMMWGPYAGANLTDEQQAQITTIQDEVSKKQWDLMGQMQDEQFKLQQLYSTPKRDNAAINDAYKRLSSARRQMHEAMLDARKRTEAVLTPEQRNEMRRGWQHGWGR